MRSRDLFESFRAFMVPRPVVHMRDKVVQHLPLLEYFQTFELEGGLALSHDNNQAHYSETAKITERVDYLDYFGVYFRLFEWFEVYIGGFPTGKQKIRIRDSNPDPLVEGQDIIPVRPMRIPLPALQPTLTPKLAL